MLARHPHRRTRLALELLEGRSLLAPLASGQEVTGYVVAGQSYTYELAAQAGQLLWVSLGETPDAAFGATPAITVINPQGLQVHYATNVDAFDFAITAATSGNYQLVLTDIGDNNDLAYRLRAVTLPQIATPIEDRDLPLYDGWEYDSFLWTGSFNVHPFSTTAGSIVEVGVTELPTGNVAGSRPELYIVGPNHNVIAFDDGGSTATVEFTATAAGPYFAVVMDAGNVDPLYYSIYALGVTEDPGLAGDYNGDDLVDEDDLLVWQASFGATSGDGLAADGNGDGVVDPADYTIWRDNFESGASLSRSAVTNKLAAPLAVSVDLPGFDPFAATVKSASASLVFDAQYMTPPTIEVLSAVAKRDSRIMTTSELRTIDEALAMADGELYASVSIDWSLVATPSI